MNSKENQSENIQAEDKNQTETKTNEIKSDKSDKKDKYPECRVCRAKANIQNTLIFALDIGYGWSVEKVFLCDSHAEHLENTDLDQLYVKNRLAHLTRVRQKQNKAIPPNVVRKTGKPIRK